MNPAAADGIPRLGPDPRATERGQIRKAARAFEAMLAQVWLKSMRDAQLDEGFFGSGAGSEVYEDLMDHHLSDLLSNSSPFGIARALEERWLNDPDLAGEASVFEGIRAIQPMQAYEALRTAPVRVQRSDDRLKSSASDPISMSEPVRMPGEIDEHQ